MRKIIQIHVAEINGISTYLAVCDDGTVWKREDYCKNWTQLSPIPQDIKECDE